MTIEAKQVHLYEQLEDVPLDARLVIEDSDGMGATILAIGRMCHGAAAALRAALEHAERPLTHSDNCWKWHHGCAVKKIERAEKQEPVAWMWADETVTADPDRPDGTWTPLYTAPRQWQGLTDEEIGLLTTNDEWSHIETPVLALFARAIEAKLKEKNG